jgi:hypothetical protein
MTVVAAKKLPLDRTEALDPLTLQLDRKNPRFAGGGPGGRKADVAIIKRLVEDADLLELVQSIAANGDLDLEPLFVVREGAHTVVVEGNRRVAAIKIFREPALARELGVAVPSLSPEHKKTLERVHVIPLASREEARQLIGFKHINGTHKWDSYAKGRFAADWYRAEKKAGTTLEDIARSLGDRHDTVQRLVLGIFVLDQARDRALFEPEDRFPGRVFFFSHLYTALTRPEYRVFLGLPERWRDQVPKENPVPSESLPRLKELLNWLYGSKSESEPPVIGSQNPDVKNLGEVLASPQAYKKLKAERDLKAAHEWSGARSKQFAEHLVKALTQAERALGLVYGYSPDPTLLETADNLTKVARSLLSQMKNPQEGDT